MKRWIVRWFGLLWLGVLLVGAGGCATGEPENESVRPWNAPQGWEGTLPMMDQQHR